MSFVLFDDGGKFFAGREMAKSDASSQVELESGRRVKVKAANILLSFNEPKPADLIAQAHALNDGIDLDLAWEFAPEDDFSFIDFAKEYYDEQATIVQQVAILFCLFNAPHYFRRAGKGKFKKAPEENVKAALIAIERKKQQQAQIDTWADELINGHCAPAIKEQLYKILFKPDKNALEYKAIVQASKQSQISPLDLFKHSKAIESAYQFHWKRFLYEFFPKGTAFKEIPLPDLNTLQELPLSNAQAFSIDDSLTTEIDDAISVQGLGSGAVTIGIHIAVPALAIKPDSAIDQAARERLSTVYMPGWKIPMLPEHIIHQFTLTEGIDHPTLSLYVTYDENTLELQNSKTVLERVAIAANLRHEQMEDSLNEQTLSGQAPASYPFAQELAFAFRLAQHLKTNREAVRGKPETFARPDYNFRLLDSDGKYLLTEPVGEERVQITERKRGSALDLVISELMIVVNTAWGALMASVNVPGIYRSQAALRPGIKVRMSTKALPHAGIGVPQYAWSTSPLRRYTDLLNQWQILSCVQHGATAALVAPFKPKDSALFTIISSFESAYTGYNNFQRGIERYWTLRFLQQNQITELEATILKNGMLRANDLPLVFEAVGAQAHPKDTVVLVKLTHMDELTLDVSAQVAHVIQAAAGHEADSDDIEDEEQDIAGPITLVVDVEEEQSANDIPNTP